MTDSSPQLFRVCIRRLPVPLWQRSQEHSDELMREFMLIATDQSAPEHEVPRRLTALVEELTTEYAGFSEENDAALAAAAERGDAEIDLDYELPAGVEAAAKHLGDLLDEADDYCRRGEHLLTLATPPDQVAFRQWFLDEFSRQARGEEPLAWPDYRPA